MLMHVKISDLPLNTNHSCGQADGSVATVVFEVSRQKTKYSTNLIYDLMMALDEESGDCQMLLQFILKGNYYLKFMAIHFIGIIMDHTALLTSASYWFALTFSPESISLLMSKPNHTSYSPHLNSMALNNRCGETTEGWNHKYIINIT